MYWQHRQQVTGVAPDELLAALAVRPTSWLHPFLQLAATQADPAPARGRHAGPLRHWYRLSPPGADGACRFIWHPHGHPRLFSSFRGVLAIVPLGSDCALDLRGEATGGEEAKNQAALAALADLIAAASRGAQADG